MSCCIHYDNGEGTLTPLEIDSFKRLKDAKRARKTLGGENVHGLQGNGIPENFAEGLSYHQS